MIREENLKLNKSLEKAAEDQQKNSEDLKVTKGQLEREKAKNKVMLKRLKAENSSNHNSADEGQSLPDVIWFDQKKADQNLQKIDQNLQKMDQNLQKVDHNLQKVDQNRNIEIRPPSAAPAPATPAKADIKARVSSKSEFNVRHSSITVMSNEHGYFCVCLKTSWKYGDKYAKY